MTIEITKDKVPEPEDRRDIDLIELVVGETQRQLDQLQGDKSGEEGIAESPESSIPKDKEPKTK